MIALALINFPVQPGYTARMLRPPPPDAQPIIVTEDQVVEVANLYARCADYFILQDGAAPTLADAHRLFTDIPTEKKPGDQIILGWRGMRGLYALAAILRDYPGDGIWYLGFMIVDPARRGKGIGRSIFAIIEDWAARHGAREIRLAVLEENVDGARFWRARGFDEIRRVGPNIFKQRSHHRIELRRPVQIGSPPAQPRP